MNNLKLKSFVNIIILQFVFLTVFIISITVIRFISGDFFKELKAVYEEYVLVDTDVSLVIGGEKD